MEGRWVVCPYAYQAEFREPERMIAEAGPGDCLDTCSETCRAECAGCKRGYLHASMPSCRHAGMWRFERAASICDAGEWGVYLCPRPAFRVDMPELAQARCVVATRQPRFKDIMMEVSEWLTRNRISPKCPKTKRLKTVRDGRVHTARDVKRRARSSCGRRCREAPFFPGALWSPWCSSSSSSALIAVLVLGQRSIGRGTGWREGKMFC